MIDLTGNRYRTSILEEANKIILQADTNPRKLRSKLAGISLVLLGGLISIVATLIVISTGVPVSEQARALTLLLLVLSLVVSLAAILSVLLVLWTGFVHEHVKRIVAQSEVAEVTGQNVALIDAAAGIGNDPEFKSELLRLVFQSVRTTTEIRVGEISEIVARLRTEPTFARRLPALMRRYLIRDTDLASIIEDSRTESLENTHEEAERAIARTH
jgi:hypothetical protein